MRGAVETGPRADMNVFEKMETGDWDSFFTDSICRNPKINKQSNDLYESFIGSWSMQVVLDFFSWAHTCGCMAP